MSEANSYEIHVRLLGNEVIGIGFSTSSPTNRFIAIGLLTVALVLASAGLWMPWVQACK